MGHSSHPQICSIIIGFSSHRHLVKNGLPIQEYTAKKIKRSRKSISESIQKVINTHYFSRFCDVSGICELKKNCNIVTSFFNFK